MMVAIENWIPMTEEEKKDAGVTELVYYPALREILDSADSEEALDDIEYALGSLGFIVSVMPYEEGME